MTKIDPVINLEKAEDSSDGNSKNASFSPPDGGLLAWFIVIASFLTNGIIFGIHNCYGILYVHLKSQLEQHGIEGAATKASLVGSMSIGMTFLISPLAGIMIDSLGLRRTAILGGAIATIGMLGSSFAMAHVEALYLTYGILFGAGTSLAYNPSLVILGHYFRERLGFVNGLVTAGSSVFTITLPFFLDSVLHAIGIEATMQILAGIMGLLMLCALTFVPKWQPTNKETTEKESLDTTCLKHWKEYIDFSIWKNKKYVVWAIAIPTAMFGYFVPYVHLVAYVKDVLPDADGKMLVLCIGITSGIGRLIFGKLGDFEKINRVVLQQVAFFAIGISTMVLTLANSFIWFIVICLFMGLFDGCFVALVGPIAFDLCGQRSSSQAIGFLLGLYAIPMTTGPTAAGALYGSYGSYKLSFLLAGCPSIFCAVMMFLIHMIKNDHNNESYRKTSERKVSHLPDVNGNKNDSMEQITSHEGIGQVCTGFQVEASSVHCKEGKSHVPNRLTLFGSKANTGIETQKANPVKLTSFSTSSEVAILW